MGASQRTRDLLMAQRESSNRFGIGEKSTFDKYLKPSFLAWPTKVLCPSTGLEALDQVNSKPFLSYFICGKNDNLSYMYKLGFCMKNNCFSWVPKVLYLMESSTISKDRVMWYLDSGCFRHMTGDPSILSSLESHNGVNVNFGNNGKGKNIRKGIVDKFPSIKNVCLVETLKHNLLNISQLCDASKRVIF